MTDEFPARTITVRCTWQSEHCIEIPPGTPPLTDRDFGEAFDADECTAATANLTDWEVVDGAG
jgi:hypothetical protein